VSTLGNDFWDEDAETTWWSLPTSDHHLRDDITWWTGDVTFGPGGPPLPDTWALIDDLMRHFQCLCSVGEDNRYTTYPNHHLGGFDVVSDTALEIITDGHSQFDQNGWLPFFGPLRITPATINNYRECAEVKAEQFRTHVNILLQTPAEGQEEDTVKGAGSELVHQLKSGDLTAGTRLRGLLRKYDDGSPGALFLSDVKFAPRYYIKFYQ
jgi:hypothetical protein